MSISIVSCPKCGTFLLSDTAQCHRCKHVLDAARVEQMRETTLPTDAAIQQDMHRCRQCGEACRKGLVRCWSCGAFTRPEIEAAYYKLLQGHAPHVAAASAKYELPEISQEEARQRFWMEDDQSRAAAAQVIEYAAVDDDFELTGDLRLREEGAGSAGGAAAENDSGPIPVIPANNDGAAPVPAVAAEAAPATPEKPKKPAAASIPADDPDALLSIAKQQESDVQKARKAKVGEGFVIFCPMGCKIRVQERHRGKIGRCPKCQATFVVPMARQTSVAGAIPPSAGEGTAAVAAGAAPGGAKYAHWLHDVHLHKVLPQKLRIKADSLLKDFQEVDLAFDPAGMVLMSYAAAGGGMFGGKNVKKKDVARAAAVEHLATKGTVEDVPAGFKQPFDAEAIGQISLTQPSPPGAESLFGDILVFGAGRIAVRLPKFDDKTTAYLSFSLTEFREFSRILAELYGIESFGAGCGIPLQDEYQQTPCHFTKQPVKELQNLTYYQKDPTLKLDISGYRCKVCQAVISETARAGQKLGGANAKAIAKAKCPKCAKPLGNQPLYSFPAGAAPAAEESAPSEAEPSEKTPETTAV